MMMVRNPYILPFLTYLSLPPPPSLSLSLFFLHSLTHSNVRTYIALTFGFNPDEYEFAEDSGANAVSVALLSGNIFVTLVAVTNDSSAAGRAEGEVQTIVENLSHVVFFSWK